MNRTHRFAAAALLLAGLCLAPLCAEDWLDRAQAPYDEQAGLQLLQTIKAKAPEAKLAIGVVYHNLARKKPGVYLQNALDSLKPLGETDALALAYYGSVLTIQGGWAQTNDDIVAATNITDQGIKTIDEAAKRDPKNVTIRMLRIENGLSVSRESPFKRWAVVKGDIDYLNSLGGGLPADTRAKLLLFAGDLAMGQNKVNEAIRQYDQTVKRYPDSYAAAQAKQRLAALEE